jgi:hypothetical protein
MRVDDEGRIESGWRAVSGFCLIFAGGLVLIWLAFIFTDRPDAGLVLTAGLVAYFAAWAANSIAEDAEAEAGEDL